MGSFSNYGVSGYGAITYFSPAVRRSYRVGYRTGLLAVVVFGLGRKPLGEAFVVLLPRDPVAFPRITLATVQAAALIFGLALGGGRLVRVGPGHNNGRDHGVGCAAGRHGVSLSLWRIQFHSCPAATWLLPSLLGDEPHSTGPLPQLLGVHVAAVLAQFKQDGADQDLKRTVVVAVMREVQGGTAAPLPEGSPRPRE